jgi:L-lactate dehydrogenase complex protein LldG
MNADVFLGIVRSRLGHVEGTPVAEPPRARVDAASRSGDERAVADLLVHRLQELGVAVEQEESRAAAQAGVERLLAARGWDSFACSPGMRWAGVEGMCTDDARAAPFGLSEAAWAVADTGTVVLKNEGEAQRGFSLLPPTIGVFVARSRIVMRIGDVLRDVDRDPAGPATCLSFVSGPSSSADIVSVRIVGVHGPGEVLVWVFGNED